MICLAARCKHLTRSLASRKCYLPSRHASSRHAASLAELTHRKLVNVSGEQSGKLLQGVLTNDIMELSQEMPAMYTHLLNVKGRILFDLIVYYWDNDNYVIEVDSSLASKFTKFLSMYNIRSKAKITVSNQSVYASFGPGELGNIGESMRSYNDPRLGALGSRHIGTLDQSISLTHLGEYDRHRVQLGVSEGARDITSGKDFPFEHNLDYLDGVSFSKGCYIGQELTARTHHVGETRKRLVPVTLSQRVEQEILPLRLHAGKRGAGKLLSTYNDIGLAVIRFPYLGKPLSVGDTNVTVVGTRPDWWPV